jgi:hypothetical protein
MEALWPRLAAPVVLALAAVWLAGGAAGQEAGSPWRPVPELSVWVGYSALREGGDAAGSSESRAGLRHVELAVRPTEASRVWARYDNGLTLDNVGLARSGRAAPAFHGGGLLAWGGRFITVAEAGWRNHPVDGGQPVVRGEQVVFLPHALLVKAGGWTGLRDGEGNEWVVHVGAGWLPAPGFLVEPVVFLAGDERSGDRERRLSLLARQQWAGGWELGGGVAGGRVDRTIGGRADLWEAYLLGHAPVVAGQRVHGLVRHGAMDGGDRTTVLAVGVTLGLR